MENEQSIDAGLENQEPIENVTQSQSEVTPAESPKEIQAEKTFSQAQVQAIAAKESRKAEERAEARIRAELAPRQTSESRAPNLGGVQQMSDEELQKRIRQEAHNMSREYQSRQIESDWLQSMDAEKNSDPEFAELYDAIGIEAQPHLIIAMAGMENKAKIVKDLAKNPSKYANILTLANGGSPKLAQIELNKLSASIKSNEEAKKQPKVDAPLSQVRTSNIGGDDGKLSVTDLRAQSWLRG